MPNSASEGAWDTIKIILRWNVVGQRVILMLAAVKKSILAAALLPLLVAASLRAQETPEITLRAETRVVQVDVTVRDSSGKPVEDLKQSDFRILDNGTPRPFTIFSVNRAAPDTAQPRPQ